MPNPYKPLVLKVIEGTVRNDRVNQSEPKLPVAAPTMPRFLSAYAKEYWKKIVPLLLEMGVLAQQDGAALENMCETYAELRTARDLQRAHLGWDISKWTSQDKAAEEAFGFKIARQIADADRRLKTWLNEFGLTPAARHKVSSGLKPENNPFSDF